MLIRRLTLETHRRALGLTLGVAGITSSILAVSTVPPYLWSPAGLSALGVACLTSAALIKVGVVRHPKKHLMAIPALFCVVYGASCIGGAVLQHSNPLAPLRPLTGKLQPQTRLWLLAKSGEEASRLITTAISDRQRTLIYWGRPGCQACSKDLEEPVLDPSINPALRGLRLVVIATGDEDGWALRAKFKVGSEREIMLLREDGTTSGTGPLGEGLRAVDVMQLLDFVD